MRDILRRLEKLEAERARNSRTPGAGQELEPETYAWAHADLTRLLSTHPTRWTPEELEAMSGLFPEIDFRAAIDREFALPETA